MNRVPKFIFYVALAAIISFFGIIRLQAQEQKPAPAPSP